MLLLKLLEESDSEVVYSYFPEKRECFGTVKINKITGDVIDVQVADNDTHDRYMHHAVSKIVSFYEKGNFPKEDVVSWY